MDEDNSNKIRSDGLFETFQSLQRKVHDLHAKTNISRAMDKSKQSMHQTLLGVAELLNQEASKEYTDIAGGEKHATLKHTNDLQRFIQLSERALEENGCESFSATMKTLKVLIKKSYFETRDKMPLDSAPMPALTELLQLLKKIKDTKPPEYDHLDLDIFYDEIKKGKSDYEISERIENFAILNGEDISIWKLEHAKNLWAAVCTAGKVCLDIKKKITKELALPITVSSFLGNDQTKRRDTLRMEGREALKTLHAALGSLSLTSAYEDCINTETQDFCDSFCLATLDQQFQLLELNELDPEKGLIDKKIEPILPDKKTPIPLMAEKEKPKRQKGKKKANQSE